MLPKLKTPRVLQSFRELKGNTRVSVMYEPFFGISNNLFSFYLSLYFKEMGITDQQLGGIIAAGFISAAIYSLFGGIITDILGRKKTTFLFDLAAWPLAIFIYLISRSYMMFILATIMNNIAKIVDISWNLMVVEDADSEQRKSAFNLLNIINISTGIITPVAGLVVAKYGVIRSERFFMILAILSITTMIILRNRAYTETRAGKRIIAEHKDLRLIESLNKGLFGGAVRYILKNKGLALVVIIRVLFNLTLPLGAFTSMYFIPFMTYSVSIDKAAASILGGVYAGVMLFVFMVINPVVSEKHPSFSIFSGLILQAVALIGVALIPKGVMFYAILAVGLYSFGYGIFIPYINSLLADVSNCRERAGIYSLVSTLSSVLSAVLGAVSGFIYAANPRMIFYMTVLLLAMCAVAMIMFILHEKRHHRDVPGSN